MKGIDIINTVSGHIMKNDLSDDAVSAHLTDTHSRLLEIHSRALACHCECLGMNAENSQRVMLGQRCAYQDDSYLTCMSKWGLINEKCEPLI